MDPSNDKVIQELTKIRQLLEQQKPAPAPPPPKGIRAEFREFLSKYEVLGLAVAFILGVYLGALVKALVTDMILPIIALALPPNTDINKYMVGPFGVGDFANALLTFIIVALVIFLLVKVANRWGMK
jgi:large conductance mechanosensitive channel